MNRLMSFLGDTNQQKFVITVMTGDQIMAGTDANVFVILHDAEGNKTPERKLDNWLRNDFERGQNDNFTITVQPETNKLGKVRTLEIWRDNSGIGAAWYLKGVNVVNVATKEKSTFPFHGWVDANMHYMIIEYGTSLPQSDHFKDHRWQRVEDKKKTYQLTVNHPHLPAQAKEMPEDEKFSWDYQWDIMKRKARLILRSKIVNLLSPHWDSLDDIQTIYTKNTLPKPKCVAHWREDVSFARQRTHGCSIGLIKLFTHIPSKFGVTNDMVKPFLEGLSIQEAIDQKRLFVTDLKILKNLKHKEGHHICCPIALFFEKSDKTLIPVAIQLEQAKADDNPVFLPSDPEYTWLMAKMWYNNADATYHQSCTHLGTTHLIMEGVCVSANRQLAQSHPIFKLLAPHFLFLIAINTRGLEKLISIGGWVDKTMTCGTEGMFELINRGLDQWRVDVEGTIPKNLEERGVLDHLSNFPYRDDAILLYDIIKRYVTKMVDHYYDSPEKIAADWELQAWRRELVLEKDKGGVGLKGVPGADCFETKEEVITLLTCIISTCSISHAASNFPQYDEYAFPPNYPALLRGTPPKNKNALTEQEILNSLPDKSTTLDSVVVTKILSEKGTKSLSDFEVNYIFDPPAKKFVQEFREDLSDAVVTIEMRNNTRDPQYTILNPLDVPNSISI